MSRPTRPESAGIDPGSPLQNELYLEVCSSGDPRYLAIRSGHYVPKKGIQGQQVSFLVWYKGYKGRCAGIISGASAVHGTATRDAFFRLSKVSQLKHNSLNRIIDNVVFRLETRRPDPLTINWTKDEREAFGFDPDGWLCDASGEYIHEANEPYLAGRVISLWETSVIQIWKTVYETEVFGFETFIRAGTMTEVVTPDKDDHGRNIHRVDVTSDLSLAGARQSARPGRCYRAAGWSHVGQTTGSTKGHDGVGLTGGKTGKGVFLRKKVPPKDVYCKWAPGHSAPIESAYKASWQAGAKKDGVLVGTPEEQKEWRALAKKRAGLRRALLGRKFIKVN